MKILAKNRTVGHEVALKRPDKRIVTAALATRQSGDHCVVLNNPSVERIRFPQSSAFKCLRARYDGKRKSACGNAEAQRPYKTLERYRGRLNANFPPGNGENRTVNL